MEVEDEEEDAVEQEYYAPAVEEDEDEEEVVETTYYTPSPLVHTWRQSPMASDSYSVPTSYSDFYDELTNGSEEEEPVASYESTINKFIPASASTSTPEQKNHAVGELNDLMNNFWGF